MRQVVVSSTPLAGLMEASPPPPWMWFSPQGNDGGYADATTATAGLISSLTTQESTMLLGDATSMWCCLCLYEKGSRAMAEPIRWCEVTNCPMEWCAQGDDDLDLPKSHPEEPHRPCLMVESRDGDGRLLGLLAADPCAREVRSFVRNAFDERYDVEHWNPCPSCGGSGHTLRAPTVRTSVLPIGFGISQEWVAVLPVEQP